MPLLTFDYTVISARRLRRSGPIRDRETKVNSQMICPSCGSYDVRPSRKQSRWEFLLEWRSLHRFRCRECRRSFAAPLPRAERDALRKSEQTRKKRTKGWNSFTQGRVQRRAIEIALFVGMLLLFYIAFNWIVSRDGSGILSRPQSESQP
jgi:hypothetical protein